VSWVQTLLNSNDFFIKIPEFVNDKATKTNINLLKTALVVYLKDHLKAEEILAIVTAFNIKCKQIDSEYIPLNEAVVADTL
jgi:hypothetical protein